MVLYYILITKNYSFQIWNQKRFLMILITVFIKSFIYFLSSSFILSCIDPKTTHLQYLWLADPLLVSFYFLITLICWFWVNPIRELLSQWDQWDVKQFDINFGLFQRIVKILLILYIFFLVTCFSIGILISNVIVSSIMIVETSLY